MYIDKLEIKGFGKLEGKTLRLGKGVNIIYGSNESGKSTLQWFIKGMLYGLRGGRASKDGMPAPARRFKPWSGAQFGGSMEYVLDDGSRIRVERNFDNNNVSVYDSGFNNITASFDYSREKGPMFAEKQLGINEACFEKTVLVRQMETRLDEEGRTELLDRVANAGRTGSEDVSLMKAQNSLKEALKNCVGTERTRTSQADRINTRLEELRSRKEDVDRKKDLLMNADAALNNGLQEKARLVRSREYLEHVKDLIAIRKELEEVKDREASLTSLYNEITVAEEAVAASTASYEALKKSWQGKYSGAAAGNERENSGEWKQWDGSGTSGNQKHGDGSSASGEQDGKQREWKQWDGSSASVGSGGYTYYRRSSGRASAKGSTRTVPVLPLLPVGLLVLGAVAAGAALVTSPLVFALAGVLAVAGVVLLLAGAGRKKPEAAVETEPAEDIEAAGAMELKLSEIMRLKDVLKDLCGKASAVSGRHAGSAAQLKELLAELLANRQALEYRLKSGTAECISSYGQVESEFFSSSQLGQFIADSGIKWLEDSWSYEFEKLEERLGELNLSIRENETVLKGDAGGIQGLQQLDEEIAGLEEQKGRLEETGAALKLALEVLEEAAFEIQRDYAPALNERMSRIIQKITGGRYGELKADDSHSLLTVSPETGSVAQIQLLSGGTVDQMYLALRLASAELAFCGEKLPLMLDEAFSHYDDGRTTETLKYLGERYSDGQVLLFTSKARETELARAACGGNVRMIEL